MESSVDILSILAPMYVTIMTARMISVDVNIFMER